MSINPWFSYVAHKSYAIKAVGTEGHKGKTCLVYDAFHLGIRHKAVSDVFGCFYAGRSYTYFGIPHKHASAGIENTVIARSVMEVPEVDGTILIPLDEEDGEPAAGMVLDVHITQALPYDLMGELV